MSDNRKILRSGFEIILSKNGYTPITLADRIGDTISQTALYRLARGANSLYDIPYGKVKAIADELGYTSVDQFVQDVEAFNPAPLKEISKTRVNYHDEIPSLEKVLEYQKENKHLSKELCQALAANAKMKTVYSQSDYDSKLAVLQAAAKKLKIQEAMKKAGIEHLYTFKGDLII